MTADRPPTTATETVSEIEIRRSGRHFALYERGVLLVLVCYKVGAISIRTRIAALEQQLATLRERSSETQGPPNKAHATGEPPWNL
jgi:hypothetical protein